MTTYIGLGFDGFGGGGGGGGGSSYWADPVADFASLPLTDAVGTARVTVDTGILYWWDGADWDPLDTEIAAPAVADTDSIDHTVTGGVLSSDVKLSGDAATAGFFKATTTIKAGGSPGLHVEAQEATGSQTGFLKSADWTTFNGKEPAISAGTATQYWRGDKSFQELNVAALTAVVDGSSAGAGIIGELISSDQATATGTGVGATSAFGDVASISLTDGVWYIDGVAGFSENGAVLTTSMSAGFSNSATGVGLTDLDLCVHNALISGSSDLVVPVPAQTVSISTPTTYYLNTRFFYSSGSPEHYGRIRARRIR